MVGEGSSQDSGGPICANCGTGNHAGANFCAGCGTTLPTAGPASPSNPASTQEVHLEFVGTGLQALGWGLWAVLLTILIIPAGWGAAALARWHVRNLAFSDGTKAHFAGTGSQIWGWYILLMVLNLALNFIPFVGPIIYIFAAIGIYLVIARWFYRNLIPSSGETLTFTGRYWPYLGYTLLFAISIYSVIGWAWVATALMRWVCRNISIPGHEVVFVGRGWDALWRGFVVLLGSLLIITIPWMIVWYLRWIMRNVIWLRSAA